MQRTLTIEYGDDILVGLGLSPDQFSQEARFLLAAKLYELGRLSSGQAAGLAGKNRVEFLHALTKAGIPVSNLRAEDADAEETYALGLFRQGKLSHYELSRVLGLDRFETDAYLKRHNVFEGSLTMTDLEADRQTLERVMGKAR